jgi:hypothetical protein
VEGLQRLVGEENNRVSHIREIAILLYLLKVIKNASKRGDQTKLYSWFLTSSNSSPFMTLLEKTASAAALPSLQASDPSTSSSSSSTGSSSDSTSGWVIEDLEEEDEEEDEKQKKNEKKPDKKKDVETEKQEEEILRLKRKLRSLHKEIFVGGGKSD